jgi:hypothetical protein
MLGSRVNTEYSIHRVQYTPSTAYTEFSIHRVRHTLSTAYTEYSIYRVQHTTSTAFTEHCIHRVLHHPKIDYLPLPASLISRQTMLYSILYIRTITRYPMNRVSAPVAPPYRTYLLQIDRLLVLLQSHSMMASKCISTPTRSRTPSRSPNLPVCGLQSRWITGSLCMSKLARCRPPSASPMSLDRGLPRASLKSLEQGR